MEYSRLSFLFFLAFLTALASLLPSTSLALTSSSCNTKNTLIKNECIATHFPKLCCTSISPFASMIKANRRELFKAGVIVSMNATENVLKLLEDISKNGTVKGNTTEAYLISGCRYGFDISIVDIKDALSSYEANVNESDVAIFKDAVESSTLGALGSEELCLKDLVKADAKGGNLKIFYAAVSRAVKLKKITWSFIIRL